MLDSQLLIDRFRTDHPDNCFYLVAVDQLLASSGSIMGLMKVRVLLFLSLVACVLATRELKSSTSQVPNEIQVPGSGEYKLKLLLSGIGEQYYRYNGSSWVNYKAKAKLYDHEKKEIGRHFYLSHPDSLGGQPSWETTLVPGESLVTAVAVSHVTVDEHSIPWVLLKATINSGNKHYFGDVKYVQRINTCKGLPPSSTSGVSKGTVYLSSYTANYAFYVEN